MGSGHRVDRTSEDIKHEVYDIMRGLKDPRITGMLSIVRVDLSGDMSQAKIYISSLEGYDAAVESVKGLTSAAGYVRREIGQRIKLRRCPEIIFIADNSIEHSAHINAMIHDMHKPEEE